MRAILFLLWLLHWLPLPVLGRIGKCLGMAAYWLHKDRRHIALTNLRLCFPDMPEEERVRLAKAHFQAYGRSVVERGILWWSSYERVMRLIRVEPAFPFEAVAEGPVIFLCPHFVCLEIPGIVVGVNSGGSSIYIKQKNKLTDKMLRHGRSRFNKGVLLLSRKEGVKPIIRSLRKKIPFYMLPDMDFGRKEKDAVFTSFFGQQAATLTALARIAAVTGARVIPVIATFLPGYEGWQVRFYPPWENFPGEDIEAATRYMNEFIEQRILEHPEEYYWMHRRFKTRPPGFPDVYKETP
ncbi:MAG: lipid A biosynthesis acyltransferase [Burkholderiaceae bacterium]|jgi:KDO2-lipid IV(A) lauroyltransferase|nr:lipid A biosynthesis acyltransferase [Burkholderiaceae bacterium]